MNLDVLIKTFLSEIPSSTTVILIDVDSLPLVEFIFHKY